jgi:transcription elongation factor GreA
MVLTVRYDGDDDTEKFLLGSREEVQDGGLEAYSPNSPLGAAIMGAKVGETRRYQLPDGSTMEVTLEGARPFGS